MKCTVFNATGFGLLGFALLILLSCASPQKAEETVPAFDPAAITTIGLFPITYDQAYPPPLASDLGGSDLSKMITRQIERVLSKKGYILQSVDFPAEIAKDGQFVPLEIKPSALVGNDPPDVDGLMQVHVTSFSGISPSDRSSDIGPFSGINLNTTAKLIDKNGPTELWQNSARAMPFSRANFFTRLNFAVSSLADNLFANFPDRGE